MIGMLVAETHVSEAIDKFLLVIALDVKPATIKSYALCLRPLRALDKPIGEITTDDLRLAYARLRDRRSRYTDHPLRPPVKQGLSVYTLHKHVRVWKRFFRWLVDEDVLQRDPARKIRRPKLPQNPPKDMTPDDLERLLTAAQGKSARDYAIICFLADTACRVGGLVGLTLADLDLDERRARVREKGDKARYAHFEERTSNALRRYLDEERPDDSGSRVLIGMRGPLTTGGVYQILKRLARKAGVRGRYNPHSMRHAWARQAIKRGASLKEVQEILGHESIVTTTTFYAVYLDKEIHARHGQLSWLPPEGGGRGMID